MCTVKESEKYMGHNYSLAMSLLLPELVLIPDDKLLKLIQTFS